MITPLAPPDHVLLPKIDGSPDWLPYFTQIIAVKLLFKSSKPSELFASVSESEPVSFTYAPLGMFRHLPTMPLFASAGAVAVDASGATGLPATAFSVIELSNGR